jgi:GTP cyclohydrolase IA
MEERMRKILDELGHDTDSEGLKETPFRVIKHFKEAYKSITKEDIKEFKKTLTTFTAPKDQGIIILKDIDFYGNCQHHAIPFYGKVHIGYLPKKKILGISKLARIVDFHSKTLQIQEQFTKDVINTIVEVINPKGVGIVVESAHLCMRARGVEKQNAIMLTSEMIGCFRTSSAIKDEFLRLIGK